MMMSLAQTKVSAGTLASYARAGIPLSETMRMLAQVQPDFAQHWLGVKRSIEQGEPLFHGLEKVWPEGLVNAVKAGEESGKVEQVLTQICEALEVQTEFREALGMLRYPVGVLLFVLCVLMGLMVFVIPKTARPLHAENANLIIELSIFMEGFFLNYWMIVLGTIGLATWKIASWIQTAEGMDWLQDTSLKIPYMKGAMINMYFGRWAKYMALAYAAGIATPRAFNITAPIMPPALRGGLELSALDLTVRNLPLEETVNLARKDIAEDDPRRQWPHFVRNAIMIGDRSGNLDIQLNIAAPELTKAGIDSFKRLCKWAEVITTIVGAALAGLCFLGIYSPILNSLNTI